MSATSEVTDSGMLLLTAMSNEKIGVEWGLNKTS